MIKLWKKVDPAETGVFEIILDYINLYYTCVLKECDLPQAGVFSFINLFLFLTYHFLVACWMFCYLLTIFWYLSIYAGSHSYLGIHSREYSCFAIGPWISYQHFLCGWYWGFQGMLILHLFSSSCTFLLLWMLNCMRLTLYFLLDAFCTTSEQSIF